MSDTPKSNITVERAIELINSNAPIKDAFVSGKLSLSGLDNFDKTIIIDNCIIEYLDVTSSQFINQVRLTNSNFKLCDFTFTYFVGGLEINKCTFENYLDFQAGGHNQDKKSFSILSSKFEGFVNFFDCYFESEVIIKDNDFIKGTNLLGLHKASKQKTHFDVAPLIENNKGELDIEDEGDVESKSIFLLWEK